MTDFGRFDGQFHSDYYYFAI